jgi:hypothetical protein
MILLTFAYPDPHEMANNSLVVCSHRLDFRAYPPADQVTETPQFRASGRSSSPRALPPRICAGSHCHCIVSLATLSIFHASALVQRTSVVSSSVSVVSTTSRGGVSFNPPRFLGRALFQEGDSDTCWSGAGMLKTASTFVSVTSEKHAASAPACTVDHPIRTCRKFKASLLEIAMQFLNFFCPSTVFAAFVDFADLPTDSKHSGDSASFTFELVSLN